MGEANLDHILTNYVGGCGRYQLINTILISFVYHASWLTLFINVFTAYAPKHRCRVPECDNVNEPKVNISMYQKFSKNQLFTRLLNKHRQIK